MPMRLQDGSSSGPPHPHAQGDQADDLNKRRWTDGGQGRQGIHVPSQVGSSDQFLPNRDATVARLSDFSLKARNPNSYAKFANFKCWQQNQKILKHYFLINISM